MKMCLVMVTMITLTQYNIGNCNIQMICTLKWLDRTTEILNLYLWCDDSSNETENKTVHLEVDGIMRKQRTSRL